MECHGPHTQARAHNTAAACTYARATPSQHRDASNPSKHPQDFEALTPNLLARTIETVEGGGLVIMLLSQLSSLTQLYTLAMDVHGRLRTEAHQDVTGGGPGWVGGWMRGWVGGWAGVWVGGWVSGWEPAAGGGTVGAKAQGRDARGTIRGGCVAAKDGSPVGSSSDATTPPPSPAHAGRFNERLVLSLASNPNCLLMDDELNVLPTSSLIRCARYFILCAHGLVPA